MSINAASSKIREWRENPVTFMRECLNCEPDAWQADALMAFASPDPIKRIALAACAGPGKSFIEAVCAWNFFLCYGEKGEHPKGMAVSISAENLSLNLWPELSKVQAKSELLTKAFTWTKTRIFANDHPQTWFFQARSFSKTANPEEQGRALSGLHSKYVLVLIDESGDISPNILRAADQAMGNVKFGRIVQAGNTTSKTGALYHAVQKARHLWTVIKITGDPDDPKRSPRVDINWARDQIDLYGRDNPWVQAYILGQFPDSALNTLLTVELVEASMNKQIHEKDYMFVEKKLGVDVAREGLDSTIIFPRQGLAAFNFVEMMNADGPEVASRIVQAKHNWGCEKVFVDSSGGFGGSVIDSMKYAGHTPIAVNFSGKPNDKMYHNKRSEMWFLMSEWVKNGGVLPYDEKLIAELTEPTYSFKNSKFLLEPKEIIKKRLGRSPDRGDALCLTFAYPDQPTRQTSKFSHNENTIEHEYNPIENV